ncbi:alpha/beta fold hydrolase [Capnocytophaga canimorsus]|nr:alpha/beta fold hydrolase [Capnocytophaga canimorsus]WGU70417.1 alpha/beta fold hydrolase [Capnocytophaga canimorsus]
MKSDRHTSFFYTQKGKGKAVILLHGFLENHTIWEKFAEELSATHRVITPDLAGHGKTPCFSEIHPMEMMAEGIFEILQAEKIKDCILVGHSMGGYVSLAFAEKYPDQIKGIVLMNSTAASRFNRKTKKTEKKPYELPRQIKPILSKLLYPIYSVPEIGKYKQNP